MLLEKVVAVRRRTQGHHACNNISSLLLAIFVHRVLDKLGIVRVCNVESFLAPLNISPSLSRFQPVPFQPYNDVMGVL
jgi:hypothetical protein